MTNWREAIKAATEILTCLTVAMALVAATGGAVFFWRLATVVAAP
jgi:hypothetical protein